MALAMGEEIRRGRGIEEGSWKWISGDVLMAP
jgi:hypothetical protein